jgi:hypothetical protein
MQNPYIWIMKTMVIVGKFLFGLILIFGAFVIFINVFAVGITDYNEGQIKNNMAMIIVIYSIGFSLVVYRKSRRKSGT